MRRTHVVGMPWVIVRLMGAPYALPCCDLKELVAVGEVTRVARAPPWVRGVMNLRGKVIPVIDLRLRLGLPSVASETKGFCELMAQREQDHRKWLAELEASVRERRPFTLTTDPHKCAFGRWYDTYKAEDGWVAALLRRFNEPHQRIHQLGVEVEALKAAGQHADALALMDRSREKGLHLMIALFAELKVLAAEATRETLAVLSIGGAIAGATVDAAIGVEKLTQLEALPVGGGDLVSRMGHRTGQQQPVMLLECEDLLRDDAVPAL